MSRGVIADHNSVRSMNTTVLDAGSVEQVRAKAHSFPRIHQPFLSKARQWRVTVVGDEPFAAAIYTSDIAKDDWRRHRMAAPTYGLPRTNLMKAWSRGVLPT